MTLEPTTVASPFADAEPAAGPIADAEPAGRLREKGYRQTKMQLGLPGVTTPIREVVKERDIDGIGAAVQRAVTLSNAVREQAGLTVSGGDAAPVWGSPRHRSRSSSVSTGPR